MADARGLKLVGFIFASITIAVMATTTVVAKSYADGVYTTGSGFDSIAAREMK